MVNRIWTGAVDGKWETVGNWSPVGVPAIGDDATLSTGFATLSTTIAVNSITVSGATLAISNPGGTETVTGGVTISGAGRLSLDAAYLGGGPGGNSLIIGGVLSNVGTDPGRFDIGNSSITSNDTVTAAGLFNTGRINIIGSATAQSTLNITGGVAGFGAEGVQTGFVYLEKNALLQFASGQIESINGTLWLNGVNARVADAGALSTNSALVGLETISGNFNLQNGASVDPASGGLHVTGAGRIALDAAYIGGGAGGSSLKIGGVLNNGGTDPNGLTAGNSSMTSAVTVTATGLVNSNTARINLIGSGAAQVTLDITKGVAGFGTDKVQTGFVYLERNALLQFAGGQIEAINGTLWLSGKDARVADAGAASTNSALVDLKTVSGSLNLQNGATVGPTSGGLNITGTGRIALDAAYLGGGAGGSSLTIGGVLNNASTDANALVIGNGLLTSADTVTATGLVNSGRINIVGSASAQATLDITKGVAGFGSDKVQTGFVYLENNALLQFAGGQIESVSGTLWLNGKNARVADAGAASTNSALIDLETVSGSFNLQNGASVGPTSGGLNITGTGRVALDAAYLGGGAGGSSLTIGGVLNNASTDPNALVIGNGFLTSADTVTATGLVNSGRITIVGSATAQAMLNITGGVAGFGSDKVQTGFVYLENNALLQFAGGQIEAVNGTLWLNGKNARVADAGATSTNSALIDLETVSGSFNLQNGASVGPTSGGLNITGTGRVALDAAYLGGGAGGSSLTVGGILTNASTDPNALVIGNAFITSNDTVTATRLVNSGRITIVGSATAQATLDVTDGTAGFGTDGIQSGFVYLQNNALLQFDGGQINTVEGTLWLDGKNARVADEVASSTNSALVELYQVSGSFNLQNGATVGQLSTGLTILGSGRVAVDAAYIGGGAGGSMLSIGGTLTNSSSDVNGLNIGNAFITVDVTVAASALANLGTIQLTGSATHSASLVLSGLAQNFGTIFVNGGGVLEDSASLTSTGALKLAGGTIDTPTVTLDGLGSLTGNGTIDGSIVNNGSLEALGGLLTITGALGGTGLNKIGSNATLELGSGSPEAVFFNGASATLRLDTPGAFKGTIVGFDALDKIDLRGVVGGTSATLDSKNVLHVLDAGKAEIATLQLTASNIGQSFTVGSDGAGGTLITGGGITPGATVHNGVFQLFGPSNFDYASMFPSFALATTATLSNLGGGRQKYVVDYSNGIQVEFDGTGLALGAGGEFDPAVGTVDTIIVSVASGVGQPVKLASFTSDTADGQAMLEPFTSTILTGGSSYYHRLLDGDNRIIGSHNDDFIVDNKGINTIDGLDGVDTLYFGPAVTYVNVTSGDQPTDPLGIGTASYIDDWGADLWSGIEKLNAATQLNNISDYNNRNLPPPPPDEDNRTENDGGGTGEPHFISFDGTYFDFQGVGEFVLAKSTVAGDSFEVQIRTSPYFTSTAVTAMSEVAVKIGTQRVTFDQGRADIVWVDGAPVTLVNNTLALVAGHIDLVSPGRYNVVDDTGRTVHVLAWSGAYFDVRVSLGADAAPSTVQGLLGNNDGIAANDFALKDGTVLSMPLTFAQLYGVFADAWRVSQATSLLDYGAGQTTHTFTNKGFPQNAITLTDLPQDAVARATILALQAGITDPGLLQQAAFDNVATGDLDLITLAANQEQLGVQTVTVALPSDSPSGAPVAGISAVASEVVESQTGTTGISFEIYRTGDTSSSLAVSYSVVAPGPGYFNAADFGGTLPSGQVTVLAGQTTATITINIPNSAITLASEALRVDITNAGGVLVFGATAQVDVANNQPVAGTHANPGFEKLFGVGTLSHVGNVWTLDLGTLLQGQDVDDLLLAVANLVSAPANSLSGSLTPGGSVFTVTGNAPFVGLAPGGERSFSVAVDTSTVGAHSQTITLISTESNDTGFSAGLPNNTLTIQNTVVDGSTAVVSVAATDANKAEGNTGSTAFTFTVTRSGVTSGTDSVKWSIVGSGANGASPDDFTGGATNGGTVTFGVGETSKVVTIQVVGDTGVEANETFKIELSNASAGLTIGTASASGTILNDDLRPHDDAYVILQGKSLTAAASVGVLINDETTPPVTATLQGGVAHGQLQLAADGGVSYTPTGNFAGIDSFSYHAAGANGAAGDGQALVYVVPVQIGVTTTLNLLALNAEQQIASTYAAFFGRGADADGFEFWVNQFNVGLPVQGPAVLFANIASSFGISAEAKALYPFLVDPFNASDSQISDFIDSVYDNLFNRASDAAGLDYWTGQIKQTLLSGRFVGSVLIDIMSGAQDTVVGRDITTLMAKVAVGLEYIKEQQEHDMVWAGASDVTAATALLDAVTDAPQTILTGIRNAETLVADHP